MKFTEEQLLAYHYGVLDEVCHNREEAQNMHEAIASDSECQLWLEQQRHLDSHLTHAIKEQLPPLAGINVQAAVANKLSLRRLCLRLVAITTLASITSALFMVLGFGYALTEWGVSNTILSAIAVVRGIVDVVTLLQLMFVGVISSHTTSIWSPFNQPASLIPWAVALLLFTVTVTLIQRRFKTVKSNGGFQCLV